MLPDGEAEPRPLIGLPHPRTARPRPSSESEIMADEPETNVEDAVRFLEWKRPGGPWALIAPTPDWDRGTPLTLIHDATGLRSFVEAKSGKFGLFYPVAEAKPGLRQQPEKRHLIETRLLHVDLDPPPGLAPAGFDEWARAKVEEVRAQTHSPRPSCVVLSGNGLHLLWKLAQPHPLGGSDVIVADFEAYTNGLAVAFGANDGTWNANRVLRLPGTINLPNMKKRKDGRSARESSIVELHTERVYTLADFRALPVESNGKAAGKAASGRAAAPERDEVRRLAEPAELDQWGAPPWVGAVIVEGTDPTEEDRWGGDRSKAQWAVTCELARCGVPQGLIVGILTDKTWGIAAHVLDQKRPLDYAWRQVEKALAAAEADGGDFARDKDRKVYANHQGNVRLALRKLGVSVRHDVFADRMLIEGLSERGPNLDDAALDRLWLAIDERFGFRPSLEFFTKVVMDEARNGRFHPVRDYIDALRWDGEPRVNGWLSAYGGADDSAYTRAVSALVLVAAVRRIRQPGVKFDEMLVLESPQGTNKSSALRVLAVRDEWFVDDLPLNAEGKVVIERLAGRWIAEAGELKGMRKGEVEHLKAFLSRQEDTARMSYARLPVIVPRQCVIVGTTNSERYLRDLTGNRRFWPVRVEGFDLERLRADVEQLWAEAAHREAAGESIRLDPTLWAAAGEEQDARRVEDPFVITLAAALGEQTGKISSAAVWSLLRIPTGQQTQEHNARVGDAMRELGFQRKKLRFGNPTTEWGYARGTPEEWSQFIIVGSSRDDDWPEPPY